MSRNLSARSFKVSCVLQVTENSLTGSYFKKNQNYFAKEWKKFCKTHGIKITSTFWKEQTINIKCINAPDEGADSVGIKILLLQWDGICLFDDASVTAKEAKVFIEQIYQDFLDGKVCSQNRFNCIRESVVQPIFHA